MKLVIENKKLIIDLEGWEKFFTFKFDGHFEIPLAHITSVSFAPPKTDWREARAPGMFVPRLIKAGTWYSPRGKEFWYVRRSRPQTVVFELQNEKYDRLILGFPVGDMIESTLRAHRLPVTTP